MKKYFVFLLAMLLLLAPAALAAEGDTPMFTSGALTWPIGIDVAAAGGIGAPKGERNKSLTIELPLTNLGNKPLYFVSITPEVTINLETFPFEIKQLDYTTKYNGTLGQGAPWFVSYTFTVANYATRGIKQVNFILSYREEDSLKVEPQTIILPVFVNITRGYSPGGGGGTVRPMPKLIVEKFSLSEDRLFAGENFTLTMYLRNTSTTEGIRNLEINIGDPSGTILPGGSGSGTMFVDAIGKDETIAQEIKLQSAPDADAKAYTLSLSFGYDGATSRQPFTAETTITLRISQRLRVKADDPVSFGEPWVGQPYDLYMNVYNMGKSIVYNCAISVEGPGMSMLEPFFGGNLAPGGTLGADFALMFEQGGFLQGEMVVSYEDVYGELFEQRIPFERFVNEEFYNPDGDFGIDGPAFPDIGMPDMPTRPVRRTGNLTLWLLIGGGAVVLVGGGLTAFFLIRKKRKGNG
ncbi:MAG: hypothetical protein FWE69_00110 [Clostridiales bacterium]|nr:hypothetical protein [Clostridiales bacterium]